MSNIKNDLYEASINRFARTIVVKDQDAALAINRALRERQFVVNENLPESWKYYKHLAGEYHPSDVEMQIVSLDTQENIIFNKANLAIHLATKREYYYGSEYFNALVEKYPEQELLIRRILNPIDQATAIAAQNGTILYYEASEVEASETNLIPKLQQWIYDTLRRWDCYGFRKTDELYPVALFGIIYAFIPTQVRTIRRENCHTYQAHSFHIWNYLESNGRLGRFRRFLTAKQAMWLYRNIRWVNKNAGRLQTFDELLRVILSERNIPLGAFNFEPDVSTIGAQTSALSAGVTADVIDTSTAGLYPEARLLRTPLNLLDIQEPTPVFKTILGISEQQVPLARDNGMFLIDSVRETTDSLVNSFVTQLPIKAYESEMVDLTDQKPYTFYDVLLNHWLDLGATARYTAIISVTNPFTGDIMSMNAREAFVAWLYVVNKLNNVDIPEIPVVVANRVRRRREPSFAQLRRLATKRHVTDSLLLEMLESQPPVGTIISTEGFYRTCKDIHSTMMTHYKLVGKQSHYRARGQVENVMLAFYGHHRRTIADDDGQTFADFFSARGWQIDSLRAFDLEILLKSIFEKMTGIDTQAIISLKDLQAMLLRLMSTLGTYSTHYLQTINESPAIVLNPIPVRVGDFGTRMAATHYYNAAIRTMRVDTEWKQQHAYAVLSPTVRQRQSTAQYVEAPMPMSLHQRVNTSHTKYFNSATTRVRQAGFSGTDQSTIYP